MKNDLAMPAVLSTRERSAAKRPGRDKVAVWLIVAGGAAAMTQLDPYVVTVLGKIFALWIIVLGLQLLISHAGVLTLGHAAFVACGGYVAGSFALMGPHSLWWMLAVVVAASAALGALVGTAVLRTKGLYQLMATLAIGQMVYYGLQSLRFLGGDDGFALTVRPSLFGSLGLESDRVLGLTVVLLAAVSVWVIQRLRASELGVLMQATRDDDRRVASMGATPYLVRLAAFAVSAALAGLGGAMLAHLSRFTSPQLGHWLMSGELMVLVLLGGSRTRSGLFFACAAVVAVQEVLSRYTDHWPLALGILVLGRVLVASSKGAHE